MAKYPILISGSLLVLYFCILQVRSAPSLLDNEDTLYKDRTATKRLIMEQLKWDKEDKAAALHSPPADEDLDSEGSQTVIPTVDITPRKLHFIKASLYSIQCGAFLFMLQKTDSMFIIENILTPPTVLFCLHRVQNAICIVKERLRRNKLPWSVDTVRWT